MTVDDLKNHYECKSLLELCEKLGVSNTTIHKWKTKGIPPRTQALYEVKTKGKLKADC